MPTWFRRQSPPLGDVSITLGPWFGTLTLLVVTSVREVKGRRRTNRTKQFDQDEPECLCFLPLTWSKSCPRPFGLTAVTAHSRQAARLSPHSAVFDFPDQIIHLQLGRGWGIEAQVRLIFTDLRGEAAVTLLLVLFILSLLSNFFIHGKNIFISCTSTLWCFRQPARELGTGSDVNLGPKKPTWCSGEFHMRSMEGKLIGSFS